MQVLGATVKAPWQARHCEYQAVSERIIKAGKGKKRNRGFGAISSHLGPFANEDDPPPLLGLLGTAPLPPGPGPSSLDPPTTCSPRGCRAPSSVEAPGTAPPSHGGRSPAPSPPSGSCWAYGSRGRAGWFGRPAVVGTAGWGFSLHS